jgi:hypothetical protein
MCRIGGRQRSGAARYRGVAVEIPPLIYLEPNLMKNWRHCLAGSLTGVVASKRVTEAFKGTLSTLGNRALSAIAQGCLTVRRTGRTGSKDGYSDPVVPHGRAIAQRIKGTPGITG